MSLNSQNIEHADLAMKPRQIGLSTVTLPKVIADCTNDRRQHARRHIASWLEEVHGIVVRTSAAVSGLDACIASVGIVVRNGTMHTWGEWVSRPIVI